MLHYPVPAILHVSASDSVFKKLIKLVFFIYLLLFCTYILIYERNGPILVRKSKNSTLIWTFRVAVLSYFFHACVWRLY